jgi:pyridoxamine 5'-phosphate oxidase
VLRPESIEFWTSAEDRLHERTLYVREGAGWSESSLYP